MRKPNIRPISGREIEGIFTGRNFIQRLKKAANITWETDHETGFSVIRDIYTSRFLYGEVVGFDAENNYTCNPNEGITGRFERSIESLLRKDYLSLEEGNIIPIIDLHMHPFPSTSNPSEPDIRTMFRRRENLIYNKIYGSVINCRPIYIIGSQPNQNRNIDLLILQETFEKPLREGFAEILVSLVDNDPEHKNDNATISKLYNKQRGIQAEMISFVRVDGAYMLRKGDNNKLSKFASNPKFLGFVENEFDEE